jgi:signal transduction histidine kinase
MVKEIVRIHHGEVDLSSEVGEGSTFRVRLPLYLEAEGIQ